MHPGNGFVIFAGDIADLFFRVSWPVPGFVIIPDPVEVDLGDAKTVKEFIRTIRYQRNTGRMVFIVTIPAAIVDDIPVIGPRIHGAVAGRATGRHGIAHKRLVMFALLVVKVGYQMGHHAINVCKNKGANRLLQG